MVVDAEPAACPVATVAAHLPAASWYRRKASEGTTRPIEPACARQRVTRRKEGLFVYYGLAGEDVFRLCDIMCGRLAAEAQNRRQVLSGR